METFYKSESDLYKQSYYDAQDRISQMNFQLGWLRGTLKRLGELVENGDVTFVSKHRVAELESIINAFQESENQAKKYLGKTSDAE